MKRTLIYGGLVALGLFSCWLLSMADTLALLTAYSSPMLSGEAARWVIWGAWAWVAVNALASLAAGCALSKKTVRVAVFEFPQHWIFALVAWVVGVLVAFLTGDVHAATVLSWSGVPWLAALVGQSLRCNRA